MKRTRKKLHPVARAIENVLSVGHTPRLQVDARRRDVLIPEHVRERWGPRLILDLDPSWPLALEHSKDALEVDLAFQGIVDRCRLPYASIYAIVDRATGQGQVFREHLPLETLPPELVAGGGPPPEAVPERPRVSLTAVRTPPAEARETPIPSSPAVTTSAGGEPAPGPTAPAPPTSDEEARARRARFRVIPGGG